MSRIIRSLAIMTLTVGTVASLGTAAQANSMSTAYAVGTYHHVGKSWNVKVVSSDRNANAEIANANMFNDPPKAGYQYVLVKVRARKITAGAGNAYFDLGYNLLGRATHHLYSGCDEVAPQDMMETDDVYKGGAVTGNVCFMVRKTDIAAHGLKLRVNDSWSYTNTNTWFRIA